MTADVEIPAAPVKDDRGTILDLFLRNVRDHPDVVAIIDGPPGAQDETTWGEFGRRASAVSRALLDLGVRKGDVVALQQVNRAEHVIADMGVLLAGATPTSVYNTLAPEQVAYQAGDCRAKVAIVDADHVETWLKVRADLPGLEHIVVLDEDDPPQDVLRWSDLMAGGESALSDGAELTRIRDAVDPKDPLTIIYTSGTTGPPKGVVLTHEGIRFTMDRTYRLLEQVAVRNNLRAYRHWVVDGRLRVPVGLSQMSYLPLAHIAERFNSYYFSCMWATTVTYVRDLLDLPAILPVCRPMTFAAVPRVWEKFHAGIVGKIEAEPNARKRRLGLLALEVAREHGMASMEGRRPGLGTQLLHPVFERLVYGRVRRAMGLDRCIVAMSGAAPIAPELLATFTGMGVRISEAYGMTEASVVITLTPADRPRVGTVGLPIEDTEVRIAEDGEVLARGPHVMPGYLNRPEATAEAIDSDGWLHTGDLGVLDEAGYLRIVGRKKELIITAGGKNISPNNIEETIKTASSIIGQVCAVGDDRPYIAALIVLDSEALATWCAGNGIPFESFAAASQHPRVLDEVRRAVDEGNAHLSRVEQVKRWRVLDGEWTLDSEELTPTMKLKRRVIQERHAPEIAGLYE